MTLRDATRYMTLLKEHFLYNERRAPSISKRFLETILQSFLTMAKSSFFLAYVFWLLVWQVFQSGGGFLESRLRLCVLPSK